MAMRGGGPAPDGGWGWVVVVCSLFILALTNGLMTSLGVMYVFWLEEFGDSRGKTSWIISIAFAAMFGLGTGSSLAYLSVVAVVSAYFTSRLTIAMGIALSGVGIGAFATSPLLNHLTEMYGWRGALLITGATCLHICLFGLLLRPPPMVVSSGQTPGMVCVEINIEEIADDCSLVLQQENVGWISDGREVSVDENTQDLKSESGNSYTLYQTKYLNDSHGNNGMVTRSMKECITNGHRPLLHNKLLDIGQRPAPVCRTFNPKGSLDAHLNAPDNKGTFPFISLVELRAKESHENVPTQRQPSKKDLSLDVVFARSFKHLNSIALSASVNNLLKHGENHFVRKFLRTDDENEIHSPDMTTLEKLEEKTRIQKCKQFILGTLHSNVSLLKDPTFCLFVVSNFLTNLSYITPVVYMVDRAIGNGMDTSVGAMLIGSNGVGSIVGRVFFGIVTYRLFPDRLVTYIFILAMAGISTMLSPLCGGNEPLHFIYAALIGAFIGGYSTLCPIVCIDLMGIEKSLKSFGLLLTFAGIASLLGPPLGGLMFDLSHTYVITYMVHGLFLLVSVIILIPTAWRRRRRQRHQQQ